MNEIILDSESPSVVTRRNAVSASLTSGPENGDSGVSAWSRRRKRLAIVAAAFLAESIPLWRHGYVGGNVVVRCRQGHLFTTIWFPGASLKSLRLGSRRVQWCPVGRHWSLVELVRESDLSGRERRNARKHKDVRIP
jgi:hypothetical protein